MADVASKNTSQSPPSPAAPTPDIPHQHTMETRSSPSMKELRALAAERGLKYYRHLSKPELFDLLQRKEGGCPSTAPSTPVATPSQATTGACPKESSTSRSESPSETSASRQSPSALTISPIRLKVKRCSERISSLKSKAEPDHELDVEESNNKRMKRVINTLDPIMLTELGPHTFEFKRTNGSIVAYNLETLVQYILATGDFSEPQTRIPFSDEDLRRMDLEATRAKLGLRSVLDAKHNKHEFDDKKVKRDGLLGLERCAGEFVTKMLQIIESEDSEEGEMVLLMDVFPSFSDIFEQIRRNDKEYAKQCMNHFKAFVRGPKNRPTVDNSGLLPVIMTFLDDVAKGRQAASAFGF